MIPLSAQSILLDTTFKQFFIQIVFKVDFNDGKNDYFTTLITLGICEKTINLLLLNIAMKIAKMNM